MVTIPIEILFAALAMVAIPVTAAPLQPGTETCGDDLVVRRSATSPTRDDVAPLDPRSSYGKWSLTTSIDPSTLEDQVHDGWIAATDRGRLPSIEPFGSYVAKVNREKSRHHSGGHSSVVPSVGPEKHQAPGHGAGRASIRGSKRAEASQAWAQISQSGINLHSFFGNKEPPEYEMSMWRPKDSTRKRIAKRTAASLKAKQRGRNELKRSPTHPGASSEEGSAAAPRLSSTTHTDNNSRNAKIAHMQKMRVE